MSAHTCTLPLWCRRRFKLAGQRSKPKLPQLRQERRRRHGQIQKLVLVGWRRPRGASELPHPCRLASDSARPSQRATPHGRLASDSARPSRERLSAAVSRATPRGRSSVHAISPPPHSAWQPAATISIQKFLHFHRIFLHFQFSSIFTGFFSSFTGFFSSFCLDLSRAFSRKSRYVPIYGP